MYVREYLRVADSTKKKDSFHADRTKVRDISTHTRNATNHRQNDTMRGSSSEIGSNCLTSLFLLESLIQNLKSIIWHWHLTRNIRNAYCGILPGHWHPSVVGKTFAWLLNSNRQNSFNSYVNVCVVRDHKSIGFCGSMKLDVDKIDINNNRKKEKGVVCCHHSSWVIKRFNQ